MSHWRSLAEAEKQEELRQEKMRRRAMLRATEPLPNEKRVSKRDRKNAAKALAPLRERVFERDGWRCCECGEKLHRRSRRATIDHRVPLARGGSNGASNLQAMCVDCNSRKGHSLDATPTERSLFSALQTTGELYGVGCLLRLSPPGAVEAWLYWPDRHMDRRPFYSRPGRTDVAPPLRIRPETLTGWDRLAWWNRSSADVCTRSPPPRTEELRELPFPDGWT